MHSSPSLPPSFSLFISLPLVLGKSSYPELVADLDLGSFLYSDHEATGVLIIYNIIAGDLLHTQMRVCGACYL